MTPISTHREVERKLRVHAVFEMPDLVAEGVASAVETPGMRRLRKSARLLAPELSISASVAV